MHVFQISGQLQQTKKNNEFTSTGNPCVRFLRFDAIGAMLETAP